MYNKEGNMQNNMRSFKNSSVAKYISDANNNLFDQIEKQQKFVERLRKANIEIRTHSTISKSPRKSCLSQISPIRKQDNSSPIVIKSRIKGHKNSQESAESEIKKCKEIEN